MDASESGTRSPTFPLDGGTEGALELLEGVAGAGEVGVRT
jgi:hypothetical protein